MSVYTTELRYICEQLSGLDESCGFNDVQTIIDKSWEKIFSFQFPVYKKEYKKEICQLILKHYYTQEIAYETYGRWKLALETKLLEIMPYYNRLLKVLDEKFDLLKSQDLYIEHTLSRKETMERDSTSTNNSNDTYESRFLDTPQGGLDGIISDDYLTNVTKDESNGSSNNNFSEDGSGTTNENWDEHRYGYENPYGLLEQYTQERYNINMSIIMELQGLFMQVWW